MAIGAHWKLNSNHCRKYFENLQSSIIAFRTTNFYCGLLKRTMHTYYLHQNHRSYSNQATSTLSSLSKPKSYVEIVHVLKKHSNCLWRWRLRGSILVWIQTVSVQCALHWRIQDFPEREKASGYYLTKCFWKLHENEEYWVEAQSKICLCRSAYALFSLTYWK